MALSFPNPSRTFDQTRNAVQFLGHDGLFEIRFFVEAGALAEEIGNGARMSQARCLTTFDRLRASIQDVAREAYASKRLNSYTLTAGDFR
ncbi:MAG TPA: DUF1488 domain-containing protein [Bauldia sp.]|nr:DUF1488 domain-containing protein [Bauldia sp.]